MLSTGHISLAGEFRRRDNYLDEIKLYCKIVFRVLILSKLHTNWIPNE